MTVCNHASPTCDCPFAETEAAVRIDNSGCLPTRRQIMRLRTELGKTWACHNDITKPCIGAMRALKDAGLPYKFEGGETLVSELEYEEFADALAE